MLSKKMAFSLMRLITLLSFAFVVPSAMAQFSATLSVDPDVDISSVEGIQVLNGSGTTVRATFGGVVTTRATFSVTSGGVVTREAGAEFAASDIVAIAYNKLGGTEFAPWISAPIPYDSNDPYNPDGRNVGFAVPTVITSRVATRTALGANDSDGLNFQFRVNSPGAGVVRVVLYLGANKVELADPIAEFDFATGKRNAAGKNAAAGMLTIHYVAADQGKPRVYSMERADTPLLPVTAETVQVVIRLSETPDKFTAADHLSVTNATAADPVALVGVPEDRLGYEALKARVAEAAQIEPVVVREFFDDAASGDGINSAIIRNPPAYLLAAYATHNAIEGITPIQLVDLPTQLADLPTVLPLPLGPPTATGTVAGVTGDVDISGRPIPPFAADFNSVEDYNKAVEFYTALNNAYNTYAAQLNLYFAYNSAVSAERMKDAEKESAYNDKVIDALAAHFASQTIVRENPLPATGRDNLLRPYVVTLTPKYENRNDIVVKVKGLEDQVLPTPNRYTAPATDAAYREGINKLTIKVGKETLPTKSAGIVVFIPENTVIPKDGYVVVAKNAGGSAIRDPGAGADTSPVGTARQPFGLTYNLIAGGALPNLEAFLINGGTIDLVAPAAGLVISEIMWGSDASIADSFNSQYVEIRNTSGAEIKMGDGTHKLIFYPAGSTLPDMSVAANNIQDRVGTVGAHGRWVPVNKGQSGRTGVGEAPGDVVAITPTEALVSMQRTADATSATGLAADGTDPMSWGASSPPGLNFDPNKEGVRIGSPGRAPTAYPTAPTPDTPAPIVPVAKVSDIMITEVMADTGGGRLPQWIEFTNMSGKKVSLAGWSLSIMNAADDADVVGTTISINLSNVVLDISKHTGNAGKGQSLLLVAWDARSSSKLNADNVMDVSGQVGKAGRYTLLSEMGFMIRLLPPQKTGILTYGDTVGNLDAAEAWDIPMAEGARSSLIRREATIAGTATLGTAANGWVMASATSLVSGPTTWYGSDEDAGTPGYDAGGPLPVELSVFYPARDKITGEAVIKWETQSELNNAGFFIKRSQQRNRNFKVINAAMISGAGTISEKQSYTYTDTTAQANVVYYYQIEDVSLDGNRQLLIRGIRLRGHIGAGGKATVMWGDLKIQE